MGNWISDSGLHNESRTDVIHSALKNLRVELERIYPTLENEQFLKMQTIYNELWDHSPCVEPYWIALVTLQITQYKNPFIHLFMLESLLYMCKHPELVEPIRQYTYVLYSFNDVLDTYYDSTSPHFKDNTWLTYRMGWKQSRLFQKLLNAFDKKDDMPRLQHADVFRCVLIEDKNIAKKFDSVSFISHRFTSASFREPELSCPWIESPGKRFTYKQIDFQFEIKQPLHCLYLGFLSQVPSEHEVLFGPNLEYLITKTLNVSDWLTVKHAVIRYKMVDS